MPVIAILGVSTSGVDLALQFARANYRVVVEDIFPGRLRTFTELMDSQLASLDPAESEHLRRNITLVHTVEDAVREADIAIDSVPDELESKLEIFSMLDRMAPPLTIFCTPLQSLSITDLAACTYRADRCIALHAANSDERWPTAHHLVLVRGSATSNATTAVMEHAWRAIGREVTVILDPASAPK